MLPRSRWQCLRAANPLSIDVSLTRVSVAVPPNRRTFCESRPCRSKIGKAPVAIPEGVEFNLLAPAILKNNSGVALAPASSKAHIKGPLGEMSIEFPSYMKVTRKGGAGPVVLGIQDANIRHQREMWGEQSHRQALSQLAY